MKYYVNVPTLGVFDDPTLGGELTDEMLYGMHAEILEESGDSAFIRTMYRYEGHCSRQALMPSEIEPDGFVRSLTADILSEPKYASRILLTIPKGAMIKLGQIQGSWREVVMLNGSTGFVRTEHVIAFADYRVTGEAELRSQVIDWAMGYLGVQYRWGGKSSLGIDCSGLTSIAYLLSGYTIYRNALIKESFGMETIPFEEIQPADLIYFPGHVAMYLGDSRYVHSTGASGGVVVNSLNPDHEDFRQDLYDDITGVARIIGGRK